LLIQHWRYGKGALPANQSVLLQAFVEALLVRENLAERKRGTGEVILREDGDRLLQGLADLAWDLQNRCIKGAGSAGGDAGVLTALPVAEVDARLGCQGLKRVSGTGIQDLAREVRFSRQLLQE
jgi:hypothetical protein